MSAKSTGAISRQFNVPPGSGRRICSECRKRLIYVGKLDFRFLNQGRYKMKGLELEMSQKFKILDWLKSAALYEVFSASISGIL